MRAGVPFRRGGRVGERGEGVDCGKVVRVRGERDGRQGGGGRLRDGVARQGARGLETRVPVARDAAAVDEPGEELCVVDVDREVVDGRRGGRRRRLRDHGEKGRA